MPSVFITGASRGLGLELTRQYAADGWRVWAGARSTTPALAAFAAASPEVRLLRLDVAQHGQIDRVAAELAGEKIDVLINNAGTMGATGFDATARERHAFGKSDYDEWARVFRTNTFAPMKMAEAFVEHVARSEQKKIVTLTSILGSSSLNTGGGIYAYRASKAAVNAIMKSMAIDLAKRGILAVAIHPGWVRTDMGGDGADIDAPTSVAGIRRVIAGLGSVQTGTVIAYDGSALPF